MAHFLRAASTEATRDAGRLAGARGKALHPTLTGPTPVRSNVGRKLQKTKDEALSFFGTTDDVERAARSNAIRRAEITFENEINKARALLIERLGAIRASAGQWADLVPSV